MGGQPEGSARSLALWLDLVGLPGAQVRRALSFGLAAMALGVFQAVRGLRP